MIGLIFRAGPTEAATQGSAPGLGVLLLLAFGFLVASLGVVAWRHRHRTRQRLDPRYGASRDSSVKYRDQRDELLATLGHELRSPLHAILGLLEIEPGTVAEQARRVRELRALASHALRVAEDSLDFAVLENSSIRLRDETIELEVILAEVLGIVRPQCHDGVRIECDLAPGLATRRRGDAARLRQVLVNLIGNALAHTEQGAVRVSLGVPPEGRFPAPGDDGEPTHAAMTHGLRIVVRDSGTGMTPTEQRRAFRPFAQGDSPRGRAGIGLAVVARIVEAMGGEVYLESSPGLGSSFVVDLPLPVSAPEADRESPLDGRIVGLCCSHGPDARCLQGHLRYWGAEVVQLPGTEALARHVASQAPLDVLVLVTDPLPTELEGILRDRAREGLRIVASDPDDPTQRLPRRLLEAILDSERVRPIADDVPGTMVLVVDDHPVARRVLGRLLRDLGCIVTMAEDGASAVEIAGDPEERFDWVLLDRRMPGLDGLATAALLRETQGTRAARIALLVNEPGDDPGSPELFDQVLVRPNTPEALRALLGLTLSGGAAHRGHEPTEHRDASLEALRDETLRDDLEALRAARERGDAEEIGERIHRMEGALRLCPDVRLRLALNDLEHAVDRGDRQAFEQAASAFATHMREGST